MANSLFAASTVISERLINNCLTTYLANLAGPQSSSLTVPVSLSVGGTTHTLTLQAEFFVISARATLRPNPQGTINFTFRFHADATVLDLDQAGQTLNTFTPEIVLSTAIDLPLMALVVGNQFQLGALLSVATITALNIDVLTPVLPHPYQAALTTALADPTVLSVLTAALHTLSANGILPATNTVVPAFYDLTMQRPTFPDQQWFSARAQVSDLIWKVGFQRLSVGVNVAGYTFATLADLSDFLPPDPNDRRQTVDIQTIANLQFLEDFLNRAVFPVMRDGFLAGQLRLNNFVSFSFKNIGTAVGFRDGIELIADLTYWTDNFGQFVIGGTTATDVRVTAHGYPYIQYGQLIFRLNDLDIKLPPWVTFAQIGLLLFLPVLSLTVPILFQQLLHDTIADIVNNFNGEPASSGLALNQELLLPNTTGPLYGMTNVSVGMNTVPSFKAFVVSGDFAPPARIRPRLTCSVEEITTFITPGLPEYDMRKIGLLPGFIIVSLYVPDGLFHPRDPSVRVRWQVLFNGDPVASQYRDVQLRDITSKEIRIIPLLFTNPNQTDQDISILCRLYRPLGAVTEEFLNQRINVHTVSPGDDNQKPYVEWTHWAKFWNGYRWVNRLRRSKIHKLPGKGGCKFSNQYLNPALRSHFKFVSLRHFVQLPFEQIFMREPKNLAKLCPYCFFGGPDKTPGPEWTTTIDLASRVKINP